jgi:SAM-dependent methyltransferase
MPKSKLGLPFEYKKLPEYFDAQNVWDDTEPKNAVVEKLLKENRVKTVLDLTCGTGSQVFYLAKRGYSVVGSDFSPGLLEIAREKAKKEKLGLKFIDGDMRTIKLGRFDAAITMFNAVGHLTKSGFNKAIRNINKNLKDGGIYVFDIFNLDAITQSSVEGFKMDTVKNAGDTKIHNIQHSTIDLKNGRLTSYDNYTVQKGADAPKKFKNKFTLQIYTSQELQEMLVKNGFEILGQYAMDGSKFIKDKSTSILTVARKRSL